MAKRKASKKTQRRARGGATSGGGGGAGMPTFPLEIILGDGTILTVEGPTRR